jgi:ketosteroid isomerase-like protein
MEGARERALDCARELVSAWRDQHRLADVCTPDVTWWSPLRGEIVHGLTAVRAELGQALLPLQRPAEVTAVLANDDGTRCVVEMRIPAGAPDAPPAFITTVLTLREGRVAAARTYLDPRGVVPADLETA